MGKSDHNLRQIATNLSQIYYSLERIGKELRKFNVQHEQQQTERRNQ